MISNFPYVYVIILNWNLPADTITCVESVLAANYPNKEILVVDNGSSDNSINIISNHFGTQIDIISLDKNLGFGPGNNQGISIAAKRGAEYILLLNNDTVIDPDMICELVECAESDLHIGIASPMIYYANQPDKIWYSGMNIWGKLYVLQYPIHRKQNLSRIEDVDFISGCGMLIKRSVWEMVGLFSSEYFMYYEDLDYCLAVKKGGFRIINATQARMWHKIAASSGGSDSAIKQYHQIKSTITFYRKHTRGGWLFLNFLIRFGHAGLTFISQLFKGKLSVGTFRWYKKGIQEALENK